MNTTENTPRQEDREEVNLGSGGTKMESRKDPSRIATRNGVLVRKWKSWENGEQEYEQIVLPCQYHQRMLKLAHSMQMAGQMDPMTVLLANYLPRCGKLLSKVVQLTAHKGREKASLLSLPIMGEPFE